MKLDNDSIRNELLAKLTRLSGPAGPRHAELFPSAHPSQRALPSITQQKEISADSIQQLAAELEGLGGDVRLASDVPSANAAILDIAKQSNYRRAAVTSDPLVKSCNLEMELRNSGLFESILSQESTADRKLSTAELAACQLGITGCEAIIAETASIVLNHAGFGGRSISLLPECHLVLAERSQVCASLDDWMNASRFADRTLPSCLTLITGPSRTADIEKVLVTGVHGPLRLVLVLIT